MNRKNLLMMAVLVALAGSGVAFAADADKSARSKIDANADGFIDKAEAAGFPRLAEKFDTLDADKDGKLAKEELPGRHGSGRHKGPHQFAHNGGGRGFDDHGPGLRGGLGFGGRVDADGDGKITRAEAEAGADKRVAAFFDRADLNKDGVIDQADRDLRKAEREKLQKQRRDEIFAKADTNKDGKLSKAEFDAIKPEGPRGFGPRAPQDEAPKQQ